MITDPFQKSGFPENPTARKFLIKVQKKHNFLRAMLLLQSNHLKANGPSISEHPSFCSIPFQIKE